MFCNLLLFFVSLQNLVGGLRAIGLSIDIRDSHVQDAVGASLPKSADQNVAPICFLGMTCKSDDWYSTEQGGWGGYAVRCKLLRG